MYIYVKYEIVHLMVNKIVCFGKKSILVDFFGDLTFSKIDWLIIVNLYFCIWKFLHV